MMQFRESDKSFNSHMAVVYSVTKILFYYTTISEIRHTEIDKRIGILSNMYYSPCFVRIYIYTYTDTCPRKHDIVVTFRIDSFDMLLLLHRLNTTVAETICDRQRDLSP